VSDVDPTVERVILRCLSEGPGSRPPSALAIAVVDSGWLTRYSEMARAAGREPTDIAA
jgi:hypothetical protein